MGCIKFSGPGFVGHMSVDDHFVSLESFGAKVWCSHHNWLGPTFYRSQNAIKVIETPSKKTWDAFSKWLDSIQ